MATLLDSVAVDFIHEIRVTNFSRTQLPNLQRVVSINPIREEATLRAECSKISRTEERRPLFLNGLPLRARGLVVVVQLIAFVSS